MVRSRWSTRASRSCSSCRPRADATCCTPKSSPVSRRPAARGAYIIAVAEENDPDVERYADVVFWRPACPTLMSPLVDVVPLQLFAMDMAKLKNYDVDKPRNLAKSVTVE